MNIKNLTNSPFDLINSKGEKVRLPARGTVDIEPHPSQAPYYKNIGYFKISESSKEDEKQSPAKKSKPGRKPKKSK